MQIFLMGLESSENLINLATRITQRGHEVINADMIGRILRNREEVPDSVLFESSLEKLKKAELVVFFGAAIRPLEGFLLGYGAARKGPKIVVLGKLLDGITLGHVYTRSCSSIDEALRILSLYGV